MLEKRGGKCPLCTPLATPLASNFYIIFVLLVCMYYEDRAPSDDNCCIESIWTADNTYRLSIIGIRDYMLKQP